MLFDMKCNSLYNPFALVMAIREVTLVAPQVLIGVAMAMEIVVVLGIEMGINLEMKIGDMVEDAGMGAVEVAFHQAAILATPGTVSPRGVSLAVQRTI